MTGYSRPLALSESQSWISTQAIRKSGLFVLNPGWQYDFSAAIAAIAAHGIGLCQHYRRKSACNEKSIAMKTENVLVVEYKRLAYSIQMLRVEGTRFNLRNENFIHSSSELGSTSTWRSRDGDETSWPEVCRRTLGILVISALSPSKLVFLGEGAADVTFLHILRDCLSQSGVQVNGPSERSGGSHGINSPYEHRTHERLNQKGVENCYKSCGLVDG